MTKKIPSALLVFCLILTAPPTTFADTCDVPSSYTTIQAVVDDFTCTEIYVASGRFYGDLIIPRSLLIQGLSSTMTTVLGEVAVEGEGTSVALEGLRIEVSPEGFPHNGLVTDGNAETLPDDLAIGSSMLFSDGFGSSDTSAWDLTNP